MRKTIEKIICDRCKTEVPENYSGISMLSNLRIKRYRRIDLLDNSTSEYFDLCPSCCKELYKWIKNYGKEESDTAH